MATNALIVTIAQAVADELAAAVAGFSQAFNVSRVYVPVVSRKDLGDGIEARVIPFLPVSSIVSRGTVQSANEIHVGLYKAVASMEPVEVDPLVYLLQEVEAFFQLRMLKTVPATFLKCETKWLVNYELLRTERLYNGVIGITYSATR